MTEKLYDIDSSIHSFAAKVLDCREERGRWVIVLNRTAFFPEGGGQPADTGSIGPARVLDVQEQDGEIRHYTDAPLAPGEQADCTLNWEQRLRRMQNHSGEHVLSGHIHSLYGLENVGFHMGADCMTMDYSGQLSWEELMRVETLANETVRGDLPIRAWYPAAEELAALEYRSKLDLTEDVRIVEIPGVDRCACCAPHVARTGQIGAVKILTAERHRGGTRITALCGLDAIEDYRRRQDSVASVSALLSARREEVAPAVERLLAERDALKARAAELSMELIRRIAEAAPATGGSLCLFEPLLDEIAQRELVNLLTERGAGLAAVFCGDDERGYRYCIGSRSLDLRQRAREMNAAIAGKGGGSAAMIQGRAQAQAAQILRYFEQLDI